SALIAPLLSSRLSRVLIVGSAQPVAGATTATTSSELRGLDSHSTSMTEASASVTGISTAVMTPPFTPVIDVNYKRKRKYLSTPLREGDRALQWRSPKRF